MPGRSIAANRCRKRRVAVEISAAGSLEFIESSLCRWTRLEGRPVDRLNEGLVWRKHFLERERELRRAVRLEMRETLFGLVHARKTALRHPPQGDVGAGEFFEPGLPLPQHLDVRAVVHVALQLLDRFPDRQVEQDTIVTVGTKPGLRSASALISSSRATKPAITGSLRGAFIRAMLTWAMCRWDMDSSLFTGILA